MSRDHIKRPSPTTPRKLPAGKPFFTNGTYVRNPARAKYGEMCTANYWKKRQVEAAIAKATERKS